MCPDGKERCCRHEARDIVRHAVGAGEQDAVLFTGQGTAAALRTLLRHLDLSKSTVVFVGPFEHHANLRPWREYGVRVSKREGEFSKCVKPPRRLFSRVFSLLGTLNPSNDAPRGVPTFLEGIRRSIENVFESSPRNLSRRISSVRGIRVTGNESRLISRPRATE